MAKTSPRPCAVATLPKAPSVSQFEATRARSGTG